MLLQIDYHISWFFGCFSALNLSRSDAEIRVWQTSLLVSGIPVGPARVRSWREPGTQEVGEGTGSYWLVIDTGCSAVPFTLAVVASSDNISSCAWLLFVLPETPSPWVPQRCEHQLGSALLGGLSPSSGDPFSSFWILVTSILYSSGLDSIPTSILCSSTLDRWWLPLQFHSAMLQFPLFILFSQFHTLKSLSNKIISVVFVFLARPWILVYHIL